MAEKKATRTSRYVALRDFGEWLAGDELDLDQDTARDLMRDGMVQETQEG